ncbi:MAG: hypothetical protein CMK59_01540 [Proteobacteria bacterium]|nr:hypothetical protein [Pseudomonadota bacterium]
MFLFLFLFFTQIFAVQASPSAHQLDVPFEELYAPPQPSQAHEWQSYEGIYASVYYTSQDRKVALELAQYSAQSIPRLAKKLGLSTGGAVDIYIAPSQESFLAMQPAIPPDWADGTAWPKSGLIFLRSPSIRDGRSDSLMQVLDHEIVHILLGRAFAHQPVPRWLQEGYAQIAAREYNEETLDALAQAGFVDAWIPLSQLARGFPVNAHRAQLAYAQSADFVAYFLQTYGEEALQKVIQNLIAGNRFEEALFLTTGKSTEQLDQAWRGQEAFELLWLKPLFSDTTLLAVFGLIFVVAAIRKKHEYKNEWQKNFEEDLEHVEIQKALYEMLDTWKLESKRPFVIVE